MSSPVFPPELPAPRPNGFVRFWADVWRCLRRVVSSNFQSVGVTKREAEKLAVSGTPITEPVGQSYAAWRRSALWITAVVMFIHVVVLFATFRFAEYEVRRSVEKAQKEEIATYRKEYRKNPDAYNREALQNPLVAQQIYAINNERKVIQNTVDETVKNLGPSNLTVIDVLTLIDHSLVFVSFVLIVLSAAFWSHLRLSRLLARIGWGVLFAGPVMMAVLPIRSLLDFGHIENAALRKTIIQMLGGIAAVNVFISAGAKVLAVFPGIIRSSMGLKTLLPESAVPGWIVALIAPIYFLVVLLFLVTVNQIRGNWMLIVAAVCLVTAPLVYLVFAKAIVRPHAAREILSVIIPIRLGAVFFTLVGLIFLSAWILDFGFVEWDDIFKFLFGLIVNVLLMTVVVTDLVIQMLRLGYLQSQNFQESQLRDNLDRRFEALSQIGRQSAAEMPATGPPDRLQWLNDDGQIIDEE